MSIETNLDANHQTDDDDVEPLTLTVTRQYLADAPADEKLEVFERGAVALGHEVRFGELEAGAAADALKRLAQSSGVRDTHGDDVIDRLIADAISGRKTLADYHPDARKRAAAAAAAASTLTVRRACDVAPQPIDWLWPGRFAVGKLGMLVGPANAGKSHIAAFVAATVSAGGDWPCGEGRARRGSVVILTDEAEADTLRPRLDAAGADVRNVYFLSASEQNGAPRRFDLDLLAAEIERIGDVRLLVIDPISSCIDCANAQRAADLFAPIAAMAARLRVAVIAVCESERNSARTNERAIAAAAVPRAARAAFQVVCDPRDRDARLLLELRNNLAPRSRSLRLRIEPGPSHGGITSSRVRWDEDAVATAADEALAAATGVGPRWMKDDAKEYLQGLLRFGPWPVQEIQQRAREDGLLAADMPIVQSKAFRVARQQLGIESWRTSRGGRIEWLWGWRRPRTPSLANSPSPSPSQGNLESGMPEMPPPPDLPAPCEGDLEHGTPELPRPPNSPSPSPWEGNHESAGPSTPRRRRLANTRTAAYDRGRKRRAQGEKRR